MAPTTRDHINSAAHYIDAADDDGTSPEDERIFLLESLAHSSLAQAMALAKIADSVNEVVSAMVGDYPPRIRTVQ